MRVDERCPLLNRPGIPIHRASGRTTRVARIARPRITRRLPEGNPRVGGVRQFLDRNSRARIFSVADASSTVDVNRRSSSR